MEPNYIVKKCSNYKCRRYELHKVIKDENNNVTLTCLMCSNKEVYNDRCLEISRTIHELPKEEA